MKTYEVTLTGSTPLLMHPDDVDWADKMEIRQSEMNKQTAFRVYWKDFYPKKSKRFHDGVFQKRQDARQWCRNHLWLTGLVIVHPDGTEEPYNTGGKPRGEATSAETRC